MEFRRHFKVVVPDIYNISMKHFWRCLRPASWCHVALGSLVVLCLSTSNRFAPVERQLRCLRFNMPTAEYACFTPGGMAHEEQSASGNAFG